jgi:hypothetical protein
MKKLKSKGLKTFTCFTPRSERKGELRPLRNLILTYNNCIIETVTQYCYLGIVMRYNGSFNLAISTLMEKARKAYFKIKNTVSLNNPARLIEKLFDCLTLNLGCLLFLKN